MKRRMKDQPLDSFTRSYIETALWSSMDNADESGGEPLDANYSASDIDPETMAQMIADAYSFQERNAELLSDSGLSDKRAGFYFWLSRNGHGSGFFDEDLDALQDAAKRYGEFDLYVGDDGVIYGSPLDQRGGGVNEARRGPDPSRSYPRPVDRSTFLNTPEDMQWLRDVHLHDLDLQTFHSAILYGNEDSPHQIKVFRSNNPTVRDSFVTYSRDIDGFFRKSSGRVGEARDRVHWKGDFSNNPRSGTIEISGDDGYAIVRWDDGKTERVPTSLFSTPRWSVERGAPPAAPPALLPPAPSGDSTRSAHRAPKRSPARRRAR